MCKKLKLSDAAYWRLKANREEHLAKYTGSIYAYVKKAEKIGRVMIIKVANKQKKHDP